MSGTANGRARSTRDWPAKRHVDIYDNDADFKAVLKAMCEDGHDCAVTKHGVGGIIALLAAKAVN